MVAGLNYPAGATPVPPTGILDILSTPAFGAGGSIQRPRAATNGDYTYISHLNSAGHLLVTIWNHSTDTFVATRTIRTGFDVDTHHNFAVLVEANTHKLWAAYCEHNGPEMYLKISTTSLDADPDLGDGFGAEQPLHSQLGSWADHTYPNLVQLTGETDDPVYLLYRTHHSNGRLMVSKSTNGTTWTTAKIVWLAPGNFDPYWRIISNGTDRIDVLSSNGPTAAVNLYHFYYQADAWHDSAGNDLGKVITGTGGSDAIAYTDATLVLDSSDGVIDRCFGASWDGTAPAGIAWQKNGTTTRRAVSVRWRSSAWQIDTIIEDVGGFLFDGYQSGADMHPADPDVVLVAKKVGGSWQMFRCTSADDGGTWNEEQLTDGAGDNFTPMFVTDNAPGLQAVWSHGSFGSSTSFSVSARGVPE